MKHFTQTTANGLCTPPCGSSQSKSTRFSLLTSFLLFFLMFVGSNAAWASTHYFTPGATIHVHKNCSSGSGFCAWGNDMGVIFFYQDEPTKAFGCDCTSEYSKLGTNQQYNSSAAFFCTKDDDYNWHFTVPTPPAGKHIGYFRILKLEGSYWCHQQMTICSADDFSGNKNCVTYSAYDHNSNEQGQTSEWSGGGANILDDGAGGGGGDPEPEPTPIETHYIAGEGWTGSTWSQKSLAMTSLGSDMAYYLIPAEEISGTIKFKLNPASDSGDWSKQLNSNNIDNSQTYSNVNLTSVDDQRMTLSTTITGANKNDIYVFTNGTKVWAIAVPICSSELPTENTAKPYIRMDLRLNDNDNEWKGYSNATRFTDKANDDNSYTKHTLAYIIPAVGEGETDASGAKVRYEYYDGSQTRKFEGKDPGIAITSSPKRAILLWDGSSTSPADPLIVDYPVRKSAWKLYVNGSLAGTTDVNGDVLVSNLASGNVTFYLTNGEESKLYQGINWFGGLYIKRSSCSGVSLGSQQYGKGSTKNGVYTKPIVGAHEPQGKFTLSQASDVTFNFDGGDITLTAVAAAPPAVTYTVTIHPNPDDVSETIVRNNVPEGSSSSAAALDLASIPHGDTDTRVTWYTDAQLSTPFTTVEGNIDLYAKWSVSDDYEYYVVGDLWMYNSSGDWDNNKGQLMTKTNGVCTFTYTAPKGLNRIEIIKNRNWGKKINGGSYSAVVLKASSPISLSESGGHIVFTLSEAKRVTITYDGKVSVSSTNYSFDQSVDWRVKTSDSGWGNVPNSWDHSNVMTKNASGASIIIRNVPGNTNHSFMITRGSNEQAVVGNYNFNALWLDTSNPSSGLTWNMQNTNIGDRQLAQTDNEWRNCSFRLSEQSDVRITFDGGLIRMDILPKYTVSFDSKGGSSVASQTLFEGLTASEPNAPDKDGYTFVKWQKEGADYDFSSAVMGNIQLDAVWAYKAISGVSLNESEHTTWVGNSNFTLTLTKDPEDLIAQSVVWSSNNESVATVSNGTVHIEESAGITEETVVRITCTVTDQYDVSRSAYCDVTVAPCQMTTDNLYSMNVTGYNSSTGNSATLTGLWNSSEPATLTAYHLTITPGKDGTKRYLYADASDNYVKRNTSSSAAEADNYYWIRTNVGTTGSSLQIFTLQNYGILKNEGTNAFLSSASSNAITTNWGAHRAIVQEDGTANVAKWHFIDGCGAKMMNMAFSNGDNNYSTHETFLHVDTELGYGDIGMTMSDESIVAVGSSDNCQDRSAHRPALEGAKSVPNPAYIQSQMNSSYYRMNTNATVQANLAAALVKGAVITVSLYADAATSVKLTKTDGTEIATIDLSADAALDYTYTVNTASLLLGESAFIIKAADNHAGIASIEVSRMHAASPDDPGLAWDVVNLETTGITQSALGGNIVHTASAAGSTGAISYASSNTAVADIEADGTVLPHMAGSTTITATIEEAGCYGEASITYTITLTEPTLAELIAADAGEGITLTHDYAEDAVIDKAITINGNGHSIGNLTVQTAGDLTLSGALTVNDFSIYAKAGNTTTPAASGQVRNAANLTANGNAYFYYTVDPSGTVHYGWYDFTVPFRVNVMTGIAGIENEVLNEDFVNERNYAIMEHLGEKQAAGQYAYKKFRGIMEPCRLYSITLDDDYNYNTIRFKKADGALAAGNEVTLNAYAGEAKHANWNGVGNGTLHHADVEVSTVGYIQVYQSGDKTFLPVNRGQYSLVVGSAFMVQQAGTMTLNQASHDKLLAPRRDASAQATAIQIAREGKPFSDQLYITADELAGQGYTQGVDVAKAGNIGNVNVPQIWTNAYNSKLCAHEAQLIDGEAQYTLSLYAPANGTYTLTSKNIPEGYTLYLTQNGNKIWDMSDTYVLDLTKGTTTEYGLLLVENYKMPTAVDNIFSNTDETTKIMRNGILYILQNGKVFNAQGARVK